MERMVEEYGAWGRCNRCRSPHLICCEPSCGQPLPLEALLCFRCRNYQRRPSKPLPPSAMEIPPLHFDAPVRLKIPHDSGSHGEARIAMYAGGLLLHYDTGQLFCLGEGSVHNMVWHALPKGCQANVSHGLPSSFRPLGHNQDIGPHVLHVGTTVVSLFPALLLRHLRHLPAGNNPQEDELAKKLLNIIHITDIKSREGKPLEAEQFLKVHGWLSPVHFILTGRKGTQYFMVLFAIEECPVKDVNSGKIINSEFIPKQRDILLVDAPPVAWEHSQVSESGGVVPQGDQFHSHFMLQHGKHLWWLRTDRGKEQLSLTTLSLTEFTRDLNPICITRSGQVFALCDFQDEANGYSGQRLVQCAPNHGVSQTLAINRVRAVNEVVREAHVDVAPGQEMRLHLTLASGSIVPLSLDSLMIDQDGILSLGSPHLQVHFARGPGNGFYFYVVEPGPSETQFSFGHYTKSRSNIVCTVSKKNMLQGVGATRQFLADVNRLLVLQRQEGTLQLTILPFS